MSGVADYQRSKAAHPTGKHRRTSGCMGERGYSADPRHDPHPTPRSSRFEAALAIGFGATIIALVVAVIIAQIHHAGLGWTGIAVIALAVLAIHEYKEAHQ